MLPLKTKRGVNSFNCFGVVSSSSDIDCDKHNSKICRNIFKTSNHPKRIIMDRWSLLKFAAIAVIIWYGQFGVIECGAITNYVLDEKCPLDIEIHEIRISDCDELPCTIKRGKRYYVAGDFSLLRNTSKIVLKCSTVYLGRHYQLPGHGGCDNLVNDTCPVETDHVYTSATSFKIPYYVPRMMYTVYCSMVDEFDEPMMCGYGSGKVV